MKHPNRRDLLARAAISTTALAPVEPLLPGFLLTWMMWTYLTVLRTLTPAHKLELYATPRQQHALKNLGMEGSLIGYHIPWEKGVPHLAQLLATPQPVLRYATVHMYEWLSAVHFAEHQRQPNVAQVVAAAIEVEATEAQLALLEQASASNLLILFETVVDREFYTSLAARGISREEYIFRRLEAACRLRNAWVRHSGDRPLPFGVVINPWHLAMEARGPQIMQALHSRVPSESGREDLLPLLVRAYNAAEGLVRRIYVGNSRPWELRLPEMLQRGHVLDAKGVVPELELLAHIFTAQPELVDAITLEVAPQAALFGGAA